MKIKQVTTIAVMVIVLFLQSCTENTYETITPTPTLPTLSTVTVPANISVTKGSIVAATNFVSTPTGATFIWTNSNPAIGLVASGSGNVPSFTATNTGTTAIIATITVTPTLNGTAGTSSSYTITVTPTAPTSTTPTVTVPANISVNNTATVTATSFVSSPAGGTFAWKNSNTAIGLAASGSGNVPSFTATNAGTTAIIATITVTPTVNGVNGTPASYTITVNPTPTTPTAITLVGSSSGSTASHNAGQNCMSCHTPGTSAGNRGVWVIGGTAYTSSTGATVANNIIVKFYTGPNGTGTLKYILNGNAKGNIYTANTVDFTGGLYPAVTGATTTKYMGSPITNGACNSCHTGGSGTARIWAN
jgi:mono/diheme cytochrome c family protein